MVLFLDTPCWIQRYSYGENRGRVFHYWLGRHRTLFIGRASLSHTGLSVTDEKEIKDLFCDPDPYAGAFPFHWYFWYLPDRFSPLPKI